MGQEEAVLMRPPAVVFSWEEALALTAAVEGDKDKPEARETTPKTKAPPARRLSVPPPPGLPATRGRGFAVRPEDDPFLAAYLACTKSTGGRRGGSGKAVDGAPREPKKARRRFTWAGLGLRLSCKGSAAAVEQSMVKVATRPEADPRDA